MKRAAIYARVSTSNGQHPEMQLAELRTYCDRRGWSVYSVEETGGWLSTTFDRVPAADVFGGLLRTRDLMFPSAFPEQIIDNR